MALREYIVAYLGDLYRFYLDESGEVVHVFFYADMGTREKELDAEEVPRDVIEELERKYLS